MHPQAHAGARQNTVSFFDHTVPALQEPPVVGPETGEWQSDAKEDTSVRQRRSMAVLETAICPAS